MFHLPSSAIVKNFGFVYRKVMKKQNSKGFLRSGLLWLVLLALAAIVLAMVIIPVWLIQPFSPQPERAVGISFFLKSWSPIATIFASITSLLIAVWLLLNSKHWWSKLFLIFPLIAVFACTWLARQNHFEWMFSPLAEAKFAPVNAADFVKDDDVVLGVEINGEAVAYPILQMAYHHVVQDVVGGKPITATY